MRKTAFFLGAGFSKAIFDQFPTLDELSCAVDNNIKNRYRSGSIIEHYNSMPLVLRRNMELLLSYLISNWPWKTLIDSGVDEALYHAISYEIASHIRDVRLAAVSRAHENLVGFMNYHSHGVITLNYDCLFEEVVRSSVPRKYLKYSGIDIFIEDEFDPYPITNISEPVRIFPDERRIVASRVWFNEVGANELHDLFSKGLGAYWTLTSPSDWFVPYRRRGGGILTEKFRKLHGSIDDLENNGQVVRIIDEKGQFSRGAIPAIIPPVADKTAYYGSEKVRRAWFDAHGMLAEADELIVIGFSMPITDLSVRFLFQSTVADRDDVVIRVVNRDSEENLRGRYGDVFGYSAVDYSYCGGDDCLQRFVGDLINRQSR